MLQVTDLSFSYDEKFQVKNFNFEFQTGKIYGLLGPSGIGKSTLCRLISGQLTPTSGKILLKSELRNSKMDRNILMVSQENDLFPWQKVLQAVEFFKSPETNAQEILKWVGLGQVQSLYPRELSGGMKKRLSLARALSAKPQVLILDETFSSQHGELQEDLIQFLKSYALNTKLIVIIVSHDQIFLDKFCDIQIHPWK